MPRSEGRATCRPPFLGTSHSNSSRLFELFTDHSKEFIDLYFSHLNMIFGLSEITITVCTK